MGSTYNVISGNTVYHQWYVDNYMQLIKPWVNGYLQLVFRWLILTNSIMETGYTQSIELAYQILPVDFRSLIFRAVSFLARACSQYLLLKIFYMFNFYRYRVPTTFFQSMVCQQNQISALVAKILLSHIIAEPLYTRSVGLQWERKQIQRTKGINVHKLDVLLIYQGWD